MTQIQALNLPPKIFNLKAWIKQTNGVKLKQLFDSLLKSSCFHVLDYSEYQFPLDGFTAFWVLAESHFAVHSFSKSGWSYIELSSCNKEKTLKFVSLCEKTNCELKWKNHVEELTC